MNLYEEILEELKTKKQLVVEKILDTEVKTKILTDFSGEDLKEKNSILQEMYTKCLEEGKPQIKEVENQKYIMEPYSQNERLILFGGGHVSLQLAELGAKLGFHVIVVDDRPYFANAVRFPWAETVICNSFTNAIKELTIGLTDYVVILTRGHRYDGECLRSLYQKDKPAYMGMIGSKRRVKGLKEQLEEEGIEKEWLNFINSPVGLDIGAVTPEEIAVSIAAEMIERKRRPGNNKRILQSDLEMSVIEKLAEDHSEKAIITIVETKGSVPRKAGAKMIVYPDGRIFGTIGGGCAEAEILGIARRAIGTKKYLLRQVDMTGRVAEDEGMVCGGVMTVLIEDDIRL